jgi:hypothetical protein
MRSRFVLATVFAFVSASALAADGFVAAAPQGVVTLTPTVTATLTSTPSASASPTLTFTAGVPTVTGSGGGGIPPPSVPTLSPGMLALLGLGLATFAILRIRRL